MFQSQPQSQSQRQSYDKNGNECGDEDLNVLGMTGCGVAFTAVVGAFFGVVDSIRVLSRKQRISKIRRENATGRGCGRCTASKSMAERAQRVIGISGRIQCVVVISVRCCQRTRRSL